MQEELLKMHTISASVSISGGFLKMHTISSKTDTDAD